MSACGYMRAYMYVRACVCPFSMCVYVYVCDYSYVFVSNNEIFYNPFLVYCRELAPGTVSLTGDRAQGDDSKHDLHYNR